jgi:methionyl-tRNA formyltransferase
VKVVFMGTPESAVLALDAILVAGHDVPLVVTRPDRPLGRKKTPRPPPVKVFATSRGLRVIQPDNVRSHEFVETIVTASPGALAVVAYGRILTRHVLDAARHGAINLHFSLLPAYRGAAPVQWALASGEDATGVTTFRIDEGLDTGDLLGQRQVAIAPGEHAPALLARLAVTGAALLVETLGGLAAGSIRPTPQDHDRATTAPILTPRDGLWDPSWTARELEGRVRGFDPWPGVWAKRRGKRIRVVDAHALPGAITNDVPGTVLELDGEGVRLSCAGGTVAILGSVHPDGGRAMRAREAVNGRLLCPGDRIERPEPAA